MLVGLAAKLPADRVNRAAAATSLDVVITCSSQFTRYGYFPECLSPAVPISVGKYTAAACARVSDDLVIFGKFRNNCARWVAETSQLTELYNKKTIVGLPAEALHFINVSAGNELRVLRQPSSIMAQPATASASAPPVFSR